MDNTKPFEKHYDEVSKKCKEICMERNIQYGNSWKENGMLGLYFHMQGKMSRIKNILSKLTSGEKITELEEKALKDSFLDIANYAKLSQMYNDSFTDISKGKEFLWG